MRALVEICVDSADGARVAEAAGADRVELCAGLVEGGTTPSIGAIVTTLAAVRRVGVQVLIRPRAGDFCYSPAELDVMRADIAAIRALPAADVGFVLGALTTAGEIDVAVMRGLVAACDPAPVTFHRAFDLVRDLDRALDALIDLGVARVLTAGGRARAVDGVDAIAGLVRRAGGRLTVMAGGSVRAPNVAQIVAATGVPEVHLRAAETVASPMVHRRDDVPMSAAAVPPDHSRTVTSGAEVREVLRALSAQISPAAPARRPLR